MLESESETPKRRKKKESPFDKIHETLRREDDLRKVVETKLFELKRAAMRMEQRESFKEETKNFLVHEIG